MTYVLFFFCKQKTAYEMRISDWSSDVCSSDLQTVRGTDRSVQDGGPASRLAAASGSPAMHAAWPPRQARSPCLDPVGRSWLPDLLRAGPAAQGRDHVAQLHPGMEQARLDRPDGALKDGGDLVEAV